MAEAIPEKKDLRKLRDPTRKHKKQVKLLATMLSSLPDIQRMELLLWLLQDSKIHENLRVHMMWELKTMPSTQGIRCLRKLLHQRDQPEYVRITALHFLCQWEHKELIAADVAAVLADPSQSAKLRGEAAEKIGGCGLYALGPLLLRVLREPRLDAEVVFWGLYACSQLPRTKRAVKVVKRYIGDQRTLDMGIVGRRLATVDEEARWALGCLNGLLGDPEWMSSFKGYEPQTP